MDPEEIMSMETEDLGRALKSGLTAAQMHAAHNSVQYRTRHLDKRREAEFEKRLRTKYKKSARK